jgi:hypothetical protein
MKAVQHFLAHADQAEKKGADKKLVSEMRAQAKAAIDHLTKGQAPQMDQSVMPAAAPMPAMRQRRPSVAQSEVVAKAVTAIDPTQLGVVDRIATPPKPPTAG